MVPRLVPYEHVEDYVPEQWRSAGIWTTHLAKIHRDLRHSWSRSGHSRQGLFRYASCHPNTRFDRQNGSCCANRAGALRAAPKARPISPAVQPAMAKRMPNTKKRDVPMTAMDGLSDALLNTASDAIIATGSDGRVIFWNAGAVRIFGFSAEEAVGNSLDLIIPEKLRARHWEGYEHVISTGITRYGLADLLSVPAVTKDGRRISVEFTITVIHDGCGQPNGMVAILRDVTTRFEEMRTLRRQLRG